MSPLQISLSALFGLTATFAAAVVLFQQAGIYWILIFASAVVCYRGPAFSGVNPVLLGVAYMLCMLGFGCALSYWMDVPPMVTIFPCFILPAIAYIVGVLKGMENA